MFTLKHALFPVLLLVLCHADLASSQISPSELENPDLSCLTLDHDKCLGMVAGNGEKCSWCTCKITSLLSGCVTQSEASKLPISEFECHNDETTMTNDEKTQHKGDFTTFDVSCLTHTDEDSCRSGVDDNGETCSWCDCEWIGACVAQEEESMLPSSMCHCGSKKHAFTFLEGMTHTLKDNTVDPNFCDPKSPVSLSGYMEVSGSQYDQNGENKNLFFWMFEKRPSEVQEDPSDIPMVVWLTGGPGCSSSLALLTENGPCSVNKEGDATIPNPNSWNEAAHVLWLDQPAGVGFSYGKKTDTDETMVGEDAYYFLQSFFQVHREYLANPLFIVGESYGGHYAPAIAHRIHLGNQQVKEGTVYLNLQGLAVGNGLTNPKIQYQYYAEMALKNSHGIQLVSEQEYDQMTSEIPRCIDFIQQCNDAKSSADLNFYCQAATQQCGTTQVGPYSQTGLNVYDIRKKCETPPLCYDFSNINTFLNSPKTKQALHVSEESSKWEACNETVHMNFSNDWMIDFSPLVADLLNSRIPVLIYAGDVDFICNYLGNRAWTLELDWDYKTQFHDAPEHEWNGGMGLARTAHGFTFLQVYDAGHMVPTDQPEVALEMIRTFMAGDEF